MRKKIIIIITIISVIGLLNFTLLKRIYNYNPLQAGLFRTYTFLNKKVCRECEIVYIGDSITQLYLTTYFLSSVDGKVYNRGIIGDTSGRILLRLEENALNVNPDTLIINIGINDLIRGVAPQIVAKNIDECIKLAYETNPDMKIVLLTISPHTIALKDKIIETNHLIEDIADKYDILLVDIYEVLSNEEGGMNKKYSNDGLHPNLRGYKVITEELLEKLN